MFYSYTNSIGYNKPSTITNGTKKIHFGTYQENHIKVIKTGLQQLLLRRKVTKANTWPKRDCETTNKVLFMKQGDGWVRCNLTIRDGFLVELGN